MDTKALIAEVEAEISRLYEVKRLLGGTVGQKSPASFSYGAKRKKTRRTMSNAAKAKIRAAQKKRWAEWHKTHKKAA
jgi:hypothetical protein